MELARPEAALLHHRRERDTRIVRRQKRIVCHLGIVGMNKVELTRIRHSTFFILHLRRVPANLRDLATGNIGETHHATGQDAERINTAVFLGMLKKNLHS